MESRVCDSLYFFSNSKKSPGGNFAPSRRYYIAYSRRGIMGE
jgi:hypothetical protein